jgi:2-dehydro-3-deoxygalactonokinase
MTGELFAVLTQHSVLGGVEGDADGPAFDQGVEAAGDGSALAARLFSARARVVGGGGLKPDQVRAYLSGLLIGADVASTPRLLDVSPEAPVALVGDAKLCAQYKRALDWAGVVNQVHSGETAVLAGLHALFQIQTRKGAWR